MKCDICGCESRTQYCQDCEYQVRDFYVQAMAKTMDWLDISYEKTAGITEWLMLGVDTDVDLEEDVKSEVKWMRDQRRTKNGKTAHGAERTAGK